MFISKKSMTLIARYINGDIEQTPYLSGPKLIELFNQFGFNDQYGESFPSRWQYVEQKLEVINNTENLRGVIEDLIDDRFYLDKEEDLNTAVKYLNDIIKFDGYQAERVGFIYKIININPKKSAKAKKKENPKSKSGRPKGSRNKQTDQKYHWIRNKYYFLKKEKKAHTIEEYARLIRSQLKTKSPDWWEKPIYRLETIVDIIKKQKWGD